MEPLVTRAMCLWGMKFEEEETPQLGKNTKVQRHAGQWRFSAKFLWTGLYGI